MQHKQHTGRKVIVDFETAGTRHDSVVYTLGAYRYDNGMSLEEIAKGQGDIFYVYIDPVSQRENGRVIDRNTTQVWWPKQTERAQAEIIKTGSTTVVPYALASDPTVPVTEGKVYSLPEAMDMFIEWLREDDVVYARGPDFELGFFNNIFESLGRKFVRRFNTMYDVRSIIQEYTNSPSGNIDIPYELHTFTKHIAIDDCIHDACQMKYARDLLKAEIITEAIDSHVTP